MFAFDEDRFRQILREEIAATKEPDTNLELLTIDDLTKMLKVGRNKVTELMNRQDFPVTREFGNPRVPKHLLMKWINSHTEWVDEHTNFLEEAM